MSPMRITRDADLGRHCEDTAAGLELLEAVNWAFNSAQRRPGSALNHRTTFRVTSKRGRSQKERREFFWEELSPLRVVLKVPLGVMWSVFFVFLSYLDRNFVRGELPNFASDAEKEGKETFSVLNGTQCAKMSVVGENFLYQVSDGVEEVRSVVHPAGKLVDCSVRVNLMEVKAFMHVCRLGLRDLKASKPHLEARFAHLAQAKSVCEEFQRSKSSKAAEQPEAGDGVPSVSQLKRTKRGFTYPGTLWCGAGNMADHYDNLGEFAETDSCCRTHDHCPYVIHAFSSKYGYTNFKWHSICHCDCDNKLKACLRKVNDTSSRVVGQAFFNVIEVPCFEFAYEDQCVERHWYGLCKKYDKHPVAVLRQSIPYDFGDIDVIDGLTVSPPKKGDSKKSSERENPESATQSMLSSQSGGPEEASLRNMVTAAEDFIKVLATVSTSQSSAADTVRGEMQVTEKKKKKTPKKKSKKKKKNSNKLKGRKRKLKADTSAKVEEGAVASPSGHRAEVSDGSNFISEIDRNYHTSMSSNRFADGESDRRGEEQPSNEVMKYEPIMDRKTADVFSITAPASIQEEHIGMSTDKLMANAETPLLPPSATTSVVIPRKSKKQRLKEGAGKRKKNKIMHHFPSTDVVLAIPPTEKPLLSTTDNMGGTSVPTIITIRPTAQLEQQQFNSHTEKRPVVTAAGTPIVIPQTKRNRSKERAGEKKAKGEKKGRKINPATPIVEVTQENSTADRLKVMGSAGPPTFPSVPVTEPTELQASHGADVYARSSSVPVAASTAMFGALKAKRQRSSERGRRKRRRKTALPSSIDRPPSPKSSSDVVPILTAPQNISLADTPTLTTVIPRSPKDKVGQSEKGYLATVVGKPSSNPKRRRQTGREERKLSKQALVSVLNDGDTIIDNSQAALATMTFPRVSTESSTVDKTVKFNPQRSEYTEEAFRITTTRTPFMSPIQFSIQRAKEQFSKKKRRKAALYIRQQ